jgi:uncharacterized protein (DUF1919 family)
MLQKMIFSMRFHIGGKMRKFRNRLDRKRYAYENGGVPSIISQNCIGCLMSHDLGLPFNSPTVNLYMEADDYIRFLENLDYYLEIDGRNIKFIESERTYPVGYLGDIKMFFVHYRTEQEVIKKWNARRIRVNKNNMFIIMTDRDGCTEQIFQRFTSLKFKNKLFFSHEEKDENFVVYMPCFRKKNQVGSLTDFCNILGKRYYEKYFDYISWLTR